MHLQRCIGKNCPENKFTGYPVSGKIMTISTDFRAFCKGKSRSGGSIPEAALEIDEKIKIVAAVDDHDGTVYYYHLFDEAMYENLTNWCEYTFVDGDRNPRFTISKI